MLNGVPESLQAVESSIVIILWIVGNRGMVLYLAMAMITCAALMVLIYQKYIVCL